MHIDSTRREFLILGTKMFVMTSVGVAAFEHVLAGSPEKADSYHTADHWWAMIIDIEKCVGSGHCARVQAGKQCRRRAALPHVGGALSRRSAR
jgi:hypothetical protein